MTDERKPVGWGFWLQWLLASIVGFGLGFGLGRVLALALVGEVGWEGGEDKAAVFGIGGGALLWGVFGAVAGTMHWLVLRRHVAWARWWLLAFTVFFGGFGAFFAAVHGQAGAPWIPGGATLGLIFGAITGIPLVWLLRHPVSETKNVRRSTRSLVVEAERNKGVVGAFVEAINAQDWNRLNELVASDFIHHSHAAGSQEVRSRDDLKAFLRAKFETFPDAHEVIEDMLAEGDRVGVRHRFRGTQIEPMGPYPPSGRVMAADYLAIYRVAGGQIVETWAEWDNLSGLVQLGHHNRNVEGSQNASIHVHQDKSH